MVCLVLNIFICEQHTSHSCSFIFLSPHPNSHNGHMIKFSFFERSSSLNCHFKNLGTFVVSIAHYMRAYFNYQALIHGQDFVLPGDVGFLNVSFITHWVFCKAMILGVGILPMASSSPKCALTNKLLLLVLRQPHSASCSRRRRTMNIPSTPK